MDNVLVEDYGELNERIIDLAIKNPIAEEDAFILIKMGATDNEIVGAARGGFIDSLFGLYYANTE